MDIPLIPSGGLAGRGPRSISPTDVSQFIRLEQCERYLRLQLHGRNVKSGWMHDFGVAPQGIPPLLTRSGALFEEAIEGAIGATYSKVNYATDLPLTGKREEENARVIAAARRLKASEVVVLFQPRLAVEVESWRIRGDVDILRLERDDAGILHVLIVDMKSSTSAKNEHRLQLAFYHQMIQTLFAAADLGAFEIQTGVLYRGAGDDGAGLEEAEKLVREAQLDESERYFGTRLGPLEIVADPEAFLAEVRSLVTNSDSRASQVAERPFEEVPFHLTYKCDGCLFNEFCMKWSALNDDLSLLPHLRTSEKLALQRGGVDTTQQVAALKTLRDKNAAPTGKAHLSELETAPGQEALVTRLATTWPVGPRLDELIHRARRYRKWKRESVTALSYIPSKGYGSLPFTSAEHNPNLVTIYIDAQHDYLRERIYLVGALVVAHKDGEVGDWRSVVRLGEPPSSDPTQEHENERALLVDWIGAILNAAVEIASPDEDGELRAPLHLVFFHGLEQRVLLEGLGRHISDVFATPLYDLITQMPAFDSANVSFLDQEIRNLRNYPMVCQSLQSVAGFLGFNWNEDKDGNDQPFRQIFRTRIFDGWNKLEEEPSRGSADAADADGENPDAHSWYSSRARFNSQIPLEYAYAAWNQLATPAKGKDPFEPYRGATPENLAAFHARRLEAMEHIANDFLGNRQSEKSAFTLPDLANFRSKAAGLATALDEFITIERHVELGDWKEARLAPPERRVLSGITLLARYFDADQSAEVLERSRENALKAAAEQVWRQSNPGKNLTQKIRDREGLPKPEENRSFRLRLDCTGVDCDLDAILSLSTLRAGERVVISPRLTFDKRLEAAERTLFTPTPKQLLYAMRVDIVGLSAERDASGAATNVWIDIEIPPSLSAGGNSRGFVFGAFEDTLRDGGQYTLDPDPNDWYGYFCMKVIEELCAGGDNTLFNRLEPVGAASAKANWPVAASEAQKRFLEGLDALGASDPKYRFEPSKRAYIGDHGDSPTILVQGPPGTGKSYASAFALLARMQGAMAAGLEWRAFVGCKTHAATDVLLDNICAVQEQLQAIQSANPALFARYFDARLLESPIFRAGKTEAAPPRIPLPRKDDLAKGEPLGLDTIAAQSWCFVGTTPGGVYRLLKDKGRGLFGEEGSREACHDLCQCLVLDEASQMNLPEAIMAALCLAPQGQLIVVGDHRQMPPIVKHNWEFEPRRTFAQWKSYASLFEALRELDPTIIKFEESFRLHADMAEFLRQEIYRHDGINFHSNRRKTLSFHTYEDPFVAAVLRPEHAIIVVTHDEAGSLLSNPFERDLIAPVLHALATTQGLDARTGMGVVVPHRAQRAALQEAMPSLRIVDLTTGEIIGSAVDTVERFQGGERDAILVGATESDPEYLLASSQFLLDPRRLTVALSRAKEKMILVAAQSVFGIFSTDEETFANAQLWKNLLRRTCTTLLWEGEREGHHVQVWGNTP